MAQFFFFHGKNSCELCLLYQKDERDHFFFLLFFELKLIKIET